jgi:hypothetical protein
VNADAKRSTNEVRMIAKDAIAQQSKVCEERIGRIQDSVARNARRLSEVDATDVLSDLRVAVGELKSQIRITWALLFLVVSGLVGVAFSVWGKVP